MDNNNFKIAAKSADKSIMLKWGAVDEADAYRVYLKENGEFKGIRNVTETSVKITGLENGRLYTFMVKASFEGEYAGQSEEISSVPLGAPSFLKAESGGGKALLTWDAVENADSYRVYIADNSKETGEKTKFSALKYAGKETCAVTGLTDGAEYRFKVRGVKFWGDAEYYGGFSEAAACVPEPDILKITPPYLYLEVGERNGFVCAAENASWKSSDSKIAEVDGLGSVVAEKNGYARVFVAAKDRSGAKRQNFADVIVGRDKPKRGAGGSMPLPRYTGQKGQLYPQDIAVKIAITGDIMCLAEQQEKVGNGGFDAAFDSVRELISGADFAIGTLIYEYSLKKPFARRLPFIEDAVNYNAPAAFLESVRGAGYDCLAAVLPVSPDTASELIRCGLNYADTNKKSRLIAHVNGLKIAVATFRFDGASAVLNPADIGAVKSEGADFIIAACRWGVEDSHMIRDNQRAVAERLAAFGADLVIGGGPGVIQGKEVITTEDNREVPVFYSLGNLVTSASELKANRDSVLLSVTLKKSLENDYAPAKIHSIKLLPFTCDGSYAAIPAYGEAYGRITKILPDEVMLADPPPKPVHADSTPETADIPERPLIIKCVGSALMHDLFDDAALIGSNPFNITEVPKGDMLVVDFYAAAAELMEKAGAAKEGFKKEGLDRFVAAVGNAYKKERVVLIRHRLNRFYAAEKQVRLSGESPVIGDLSKISRMIKRMEDYFIEHADPVIIDTAKEHFALDAPSYDGFFVEHTRRVLDNISKGGDGKVAYGDIWLKRYIYYYDNLNLRGLTPFVLDRESAADVIAENASKEFIREYADYLVDIKNKAVPAADLPDLVNSASSDKGYKAEFIAGVNAIRDVLDGKFEKADPVIFNMNFEILGNLTKSVYKEMRQIFPDFDAIITKQTLPFYFKLLRFARKAEYQNLAGASEAMKEYAASSSPLEVDVWGSDISYISATMCDKTAVKNYIERNPFCWAFDKPIELEQGDGIFEPLSSFMNSEERRDALKSSFKRLAAETVTKSVAKWLVVDFFDLAADMASYKGGFFEIDEFTRRTFFYNSIKKDCKGFRFYKNYDKAKTFAALDKMTDIVNAKYHGNVILNRVSPAEYYIDFDGNVSDLPVDKEFVEKTSAIIAECEEYFMEKTGCYVIDISGYFMSDQRYPRGGANIGNYEDMFYRNTALFMSAIFAGNAESKVFDRINPVYRLMKMIDNG